MSRFDFDGDGDDDSYNGNGWAMWEQRAKLALGGKRGKAALRDLREAMLALPERRLISRALCTVGGPAREAAADDREREDLAGIVRSQGEGVCAIGAYVWHQKVKAGMDPAAAFADLPTIPDAADGGKNYGAAPETARIGRDHGLTYTLAWEIASYNDEVWGDLTPEQRFVGFLAWIDEELAKPALTRPPRRDRRKRQPRVATSRQPLSGTIGLGL